MFGLDTLAFWSLVALIIRVAAIVLFILVGKIQLAQFQNKTELQPLKKLFMVFIFLLAGSNVPIIYLHYERIIGEQASPAITSWATVSNAGAMLLAALLLLLIYKFAAKGEK